MIISGSSKKIHNVVIIILIVINITLLISSLKKKRVTLLYKQKLASVIESKDLTQKTLINRELNIIKNLGLQINTRQQVTDEEGEDISIADLLNYNRKIIFRYSELNCHLCIETELQIMSKYYNNIGFDNILFLSSYKTTRDLFLFKRINQLQRFTIYNLKEGKLNIPIDSLNIPYVLLVDSCGKVIMMNVPEKTKPEFSEQFYSVIISRLASN